MSDEEDNNFAEEEAEEEREEQDAEDVADSSEEEDDEDQNEYEDDGFVVNEDEVDEEEAPKEGEEGEAADEEKKRRKKKKRKRRNDDLDEDELEALEELGIHTRTDRRKRLKKRAEDKGSKPADMEGYLFGSDNEDLQDDVGDGEVGYQKRRDYDDLPEDDFDDDRNFIDDGDLRPGGRKGSLADDDFRGLGLQAATRIFGDVEELLSNFRSRSTRPAPDEEPEEVSDEEQDEELSDMEDSDKIAKEREERRRKRQLKRALAVLDPELVAAHHLLPEDQLIRDTDVPERLQLLGPILTEPLDYTAAAEWIYDQVFGANAPMRLERQLVEVGWLEVEGMADGSDDWKESDLYKAPGHVGSLRGHRALRRCRKPEEITFWRQHEESQADLKEHIRTVLELMFGKQEEVPLVAMYRKEQAMELLVLREEDIPKVSEESVIRGRNRQLVYGPGMVQPRQRHIRRWDVLWCVYEWSLKYRALLRRKEVRKAAYNAARMTVSSQQDEDAVQLCLEALEDANNMTAIDDIDCKFKLIMDSQPQDAENGGGGGGRRGPQRQTAYKRYKAAGIGALVASLGLSSAQFAENLDATFKKHEVDDDKVLSEHKWSPTEAAEHLLTEPVGPSQFGFRNADAVLRAARTMAAMELAAEPIVRSNVRDLFYQKGILSTKPTPAGESVLDPLHKYGCVKWLKDKPLLTFESSDQFLRVAQAEKEGLISVTIGLPEGMLENQCLSEMRELYLTRKQGTLAKQWDNLRSAILEEAVVNHIVPQVTRDLRARLMADAREAAARRYGEKFWDVIARGPLRVRIPSDVEGGGPERFVPAPRLMVVCYGSGLLGQSPTVAVMLDAVGNLVDLLQLGQLSGDFRRTTQRDGAGFDPLKDPRKQRDMERIAAQIKDHKPNVIIVAASARQSLLLVEDLEKVRDHMIDKHAELFTAGEFENGTIDVRFADDRIAQIWENSNAARSEFPEHNSAIRRAVALGRLHLDPLSLVASLCGAQRELLSLELYDMQACVAQDDLLHIAEQLLITAVNQVGADINLMASISWRASTLPYVAGLGPRKASGLLKAIGKNNNAVKSRASLRLQAANRDDDDEDDQVGDVPVLGKRVFNNCCAFLRVHDAGLHHLGNVKFQVMDATRFHPASYWMAVLIAQAAVGSEQPAAAMEDPDAVERVDLVEVAVSNKIEFRLTTLIDLQMEYVDPYGELREEPEKLQELETFLLAHGETDNTLKEGRLVDVQVKAVSEVIEVVLVQSGMPGVVPRQFIKTSGDVDMQTLRSLVQPKDVLRARVMGLERLVDSHDNLQWVVILSVRTMDLADTRQWEKMYCLAADAFYHVRTNDELRAQIEAHRAEQREARKKLQDLNVNKDAVHPRMARKIPHLLFENTTGVVAAEKVSAQEVGAVLFRPHARTPGRLSMTVKYYEGDKSGPAVAHYDIEEARRGLPSQALATPLTIRVPGLPPLTFEDLDDIDANFVKPLVVRCKEAAEHRKFKDFGGEGQEDHVNSMTQELLEDRRNAPGVAAYRLGINREIKSANCLFYIAFIINTNVHREYFTATPKGFYFRGRLFQRVDDLLGDFKRNPHGGKDPRMDDDRHRRGEDWHGPGMGLGPHMHHPQQPQYGNPHHPPHRPPYGGPPQGGWHSGGGPPRRDYPPRDRPDFPPHGMGPPRNGPFGGGPPMRHSPSPRFPPYGRPENGSRGPPPPFRDSGRGPPPYGGLGRGPPGGYGDSGRGPPPDRRGPPGHGGEGGGGPGSSGGGGGWSRPPGPGPVQPGGDGRNGIARDGEPAARPLPPPPRRGGPEDDGW